MAGERPREARESATRLRLGEIAGALTLIGVLLYSTAYLAATTFYAQFGITPAEAGYGRDVAVTQAAFALFALIFVCWLIAGIPVSTIAFLNALGELPLRVWRRPWRFGRPRHAATTLVVVMSVWALPVIAVFALGIYAQIAGERLIRHEGNARELSSWLTISTGIRAQIGQATWSVPSSGPEGSVHGGLVVLLGQDEGTTVIYDYGTHSVIRVPSGDIRFSQCLKEPREVRAHC